MSTTFMDRAKVALTAVVATVALAIGMTALAPASAQAATATSGAWTQQVANLDEAVIDDQENTYILSNVTYGFLKKHGIILDWTPQGDRLYILYINGNPYFLDFELLGDDFTDYTVDIVRTKSNVVYLAFSNSYGELDVLFNVKKDAGTGECTELPETFYNAYSSTILKSVSSNTLTLTVDAYDYTTFTVNPNVKFDMKVYWSSKSDKMIQSSKIASKTYGTTTWRTMGKKHTAYKSSTLKTKKFTIKAGSKVEIKKVRLYNHSTRYYVKTKSGKYGWITGKKLVEDAA